jgi:hypothetical protein
MERKRTAAGSHGMATRTVSVVYALFAVNPLPFLGGLGALGGSIFQDKALTAKIAMNAKSLHASGI